MPITHFLHPANGRPVRFEDAVEVFDRDGVLPAAATRLLIKDMRRDRSPYLSPSMLNPDTTCRREVVIERLYDYGVDPLPRWVAAEGSIWHTAFASTGAGEEELPNESDRGHPKVKECPDGKLRVEVYPGVLMRGYVDRASGWEEIQDYKTQKYPKTYGGKNAKLPRDYREKDKDDHIPQLNAYADMAEVLGRTPSVRSLSVWSMYRGSHDYRRTWIRLAIQRLPFGALWERIRFWAEPLVQWLGTSTGVQTEQEKDALLQEIPLDGLDRQMFNGVKCSTYCAVRDICYKKAGMVQF